MSKAALEDSLSQGETPWPSTGAIGPFSSKTKINGKSIQLKDVTLYEAHSHNFGTVTVTHRSILRAVVTASNTLKIEGHYAARIGDTLGDSDVIAYFGSINTDIGSIDSIILSEEGDELYSEEDIGIIGDI